MRSELDENLCWLVCTKQNQDVNCYKFNPIDTAIVSQLCWNIFEHYRIIKDVWLLLKRESRSSKRKGRTWERRKWYSEYDGHHLWYFECAKGN